MKSKSGENDYRSLYIHKLTGKSGRGEKGRNGRTLPNEEVHFPSPRVRLTDRVIGGWGETSLPMTPLLDLI